MGRFDFDFREITEYNTTIFEFVGIMVPKFNSKISVVMYVIRSLVLTGFFYGGLTISEMASLFISLESERVSTIVTALYVTLGNVLTFIKLAYFLKFRKRVELLIKSINRKEFQPKSQHQQNVLKLYIRLSKTAMILLFSCSLSCNVLGAIYPFTMEGGPFLSIESYFPFNTDAGIPFAFAYVFQIIGIMMLSTNSITSDSLITAVLMVISAQLTILGDSLKNIREHSENELIEEYGKDRQNVTTKMLQQKMNNKLIDCIRHHVEIIKFKEEVSIIFNASFLGQLLGSGITICSILFQLTKVTESSVDFAKLVFYEIYMVLVLFFLCFFGNEVIYKSGELTTSVYFSNWEESSPLMKKNMLNFMTRCRLNLQFEAGGLIPLSMDTFITVLKSSVSYYTFLTEMSGE